MVVTRDWYLELDEVPLATPAWEILDLSPLTDSPEMRGEDRILPFADGVKPYRRRPTVTIVTLVLEVFSAADWDGEPYTDRMAGLITNLDYLKAQIGLGAAADGTVAAVFHRDTLDPLAGPVHFLGFKGSAAFGDDSLRTTFDISIPAGRLEVVGS